MSLLRSQSGNPGEVIMIKSMQLTIVGASCVLNSLSANAAIIFDGGYQTVRGSQISTPFCQDENLASLLRSQGVSVSGDAIRRSTELKHEACVITAGAGVSTCADYLGD
jgi:hypothetical protein